jgi:hypothetical protein
MNLTPKSRAALGLLELSADSPLTPDLLTAQWRKMNHKHHPNRPGGSAMMLTRCHNAYKTLMQIVKQHAIQSGPIVKATPEPPTPAPDLPPSYCIATHDGQKKLVLSLRVDVVNLLLGSPVHFKHIDGKTYKIQTQGGKWGGWAELPGLGLSESYNACIAGEIIPAGAGPLLVILQPLFPSVVPSEAVDLIRRAMEIAQKAHAHSEIVQDWMPALTM